MLEPTSLHRLQDTRGNIIPHVVERRVKDPVSSLGGNIEEVGRGMGNGEGVGFDVGSPHELGRIARYSVVIEVGLILGNEVGSDDGHGVRVVAELRIKGLVAEGRRDGERERRRGLLLSTYLGRGLVLAPETIDHEASDR